MCRSCMGSGIIKHSTVGLFVKSQPPPCCFFKPCDIASSLSKHWELLWILSTCTFWASPPRCQLPWVPSTHRGGDVLMATWDNFIWNTFLSYRLVAVKSPIMPNPTSGALSSLLGSGSEGRKALGETKALEGEGDIQLWIQLYVISFFLSPQSVYRARGHEQDKL